MTGKNLVASRIEEEQELAEDYAMASNKAWLVEDDVYDYEEGTPEYQEACRVTDDWFAVEEILRNKIFTILKSEGVDVSAQRYIYVLKPFMERNGYREGGGYETLTRVIISGYIILLFQQRIY